MAKPPNYTLWALWCTRVSNVCLKKMPATSENISQNSALPRHHPDTMNHLSMRIHRISIRPWIPEELTRLSSRPLSKWPSLYYFSIFLDFFGPTHPSSAYQVLNVSENCHFPKNGTKFAFWDHPFKTSAFFSGEGSKISQICWQLVVKNCRR